MKPEPLKLKEIKEIIPDDECNPHIRDNHWIPEIKQRIKSACEFWLKYKDKPELLMKDAGCKGDIESASKRYFKSKRDYNEWLFKLAFKDVIE